MGYCLLTCLFFETNSRERNTGMKRGGHQGGGEECMLPVFFEDCLKANMEPECLSLYFSQIF